MDNTTDRCPRCLRVVAKAGWGVLKAGIICTCLGSLALLTVDPDTEQEPLSYVASSTATNIESFMIRLSSQTVDGVTYEAPAPKLWSFVEQTPGEKLAADEYWWRRLKLNSDG